MAPDKQLDSIHKGQENTTHGQTCTHINCVAFETIATSK